MWLLSAFHARSSTNKQHPYTSSKYSNGFDINNSILIKATILNNANFLFITANKKNGRQSKTHNPLIFRLESSRLYIVIKHCNKKQKKTAKWRKRR